MTIEDLRERITNELVLHEGNVADWQWNATGLPAEAAQLGLPDFLRLVDDVSRGLNARFGKILTLRDTILTLATANKKRLSDVQIGGFALEGERLGLSRAFVMEQWVPRLLAQLPDEEATPLPAPLVQAQAVSGTVPPQPPVIAGETAETVRQQVTERLNAFPKRIPATAIRDLFQQIRHDETALADIILTYLKANYYASETDLVGSSLRQKLTSANWLHLSLWPPEPPPVAVPPSPVPPSAPSPSPPVSQATPVAGSGWPDWLVALLVAGGLLGFALLLVKSNRNATETARTEQVQADTVATARKPRKPKKTKTVVRKPPVPNPASPPVADPEPTVVTVEEPYDQLLDDVGQYGERPAQKDGRWGLYRRGKWLIRPEYEQIEVYSEGRAKVSINGNSYYLDRYGDRIR